MTYHHKSSCSSSKLTNNNASPVPIVRANFRCSFKRKRSTSIGSSGQPQPPPTPSQLPCQLQGQFQQRFQTKLEFQIQDQLQSQFDQQQIHQSEFPFQPKDKLQDQQFQSESQIQSTQQLIQPKFPLSMGDCCWKSSNTCSSSSSTTSLTESDVEEIVLCLLEQLNSLADELNNISILKETAEKELSENRHQLVIEERRIIERYFVVNGHYNNDILSRESVIRLIDEYFQLMLQLCLKQIEQQQYRQSISDIEDELWLVRDIVESFDYDDIVAGLDNGNCLNPLGCIWNVKTSKGDKERCKEIHRKSSPISSSSSTSSSKSSSTSSLSSSVVVRQEIVHQMKREKLPQLFQRMMILQDKIRTSEIEFDETRVQLARICQQSWTSLHSIMPLIWHYFDLRLTELSLRRSLPMLTEKCQQKRALYGKTMENLGLISCYIRQTKELAQQEPEKNLVIETQPTEKEEDKKKD